MNSLCRAGPHRPRRSRLRIAPDRYPASQEAGRALSGTIESRLAHGEHWTRSRTARRARLLRSRAGSRHLTQKLVGEQGDLVAGRLAARRQLRAQVRLLGLFTEPLVCLTQHGGASSPAACRSDASTPAQLAVRPQGALNVPFGPDSARRARLARLPGTLTASSQAASATGLQRRPQRASTEYARGA